MGDLRPHSVAIALIHPQIAPNTGNIARLCVATGTHLHLVRPMGFVLDDRQLRRSAMDYWPRLKYSVHDDLQAFTQAMAGRRVWMFDSTGATSLWNAQFCDGDVLAFGSETKGIPEALLNANPGLTVRIPQVPGERCLNLATSAGISIYDCLRRIGESLSPITG